MEDGRAQQLLAWALEQVAGLWPHALPAAQLSVVSGDASFRRYFRLALGGSPVQPTSLICVDAPPATEDSAAFIALSQRLVSAGVRAPRVFASDLGAGWMLLEDFGDSLLLPRLLAADSDAAAALYAPAFDALVALQLGVDAAALPSFDAAKLRAEMQLFEDWFCKGLLGVTLDEPARELLAQALDFLVAAALAQPQVAVHRDFHSRNLMLLDDGELGVIDFQDAVAGAYTYDLVSLLRDCYVSWPLTRVEAWVAEFHRRLAAQSRSAAAVSATQFQRDFDLMGLQRHLKVLGIFARLHLRDHKSAYLADIPLVLTYFKSVADRQPELAEFAAWFTQTLVPRAQGALAELGVSVAIEEAAR